nr:uncharacterized protein LOC106680242 isoform X4 [Halyomorpha halys]
MPKTVQNLAPEMMLYMPQYLQPAEIARRRPQNSAQRPTLPPRPLLQGYIAAIQSLPALQNIPALLPIHLSPPLLPNPFTRNYEEDIAEYVARIEDSLGAEDSSVVLASSDDQHTSLILKPVAKAVAGPRGVAVASPIAKAVLRRGQPVQVEFDPDAVAIAGPGGEAHAQPKLVISYANDTKTD